MASIISDGVWWLHGTRGCNVFLVRGRDDSYAIVDTGFGGNVEPILADIAPIVGDQPVRTILLTHFHADHSGAADELSTWLRCEVRAGAEDCEQVEGQWKVSTHRFQHRRRMRRAPVQVAPSTIPVRPIDRRDEVLPGIVAIPTPGHTAGSICYVVEDAGVALVGDLVISHSDGLSRTLVAANSDDETYLKSISDFAGQTPDVGCAGHGLPVMQGFREGLQQLSEKPRERLRPWQFPHRVKRMFDFYRFLNRRRKR